MSEGYENVGSWRVLCKTDVYRFCFFFKNEKERMHACMYGEGEEAWVRMTV